MGAQSASRNDSGIVALQEATMLVYLCQVRYRRYVVTERPHPPCTTVPLLPPEKATLRAKFSTEVPRDEDFSVRRSIGVRGLGRVFTYVTENRDAIVRT